jgi:hypothetical protein
MTALPASRRRNPSCWRRCPGGAAERETDVALDVGQSRGASCVRRGDVRHRLGEHLARAFVAIAAEPTRNDGDDDGAPLPGQIREPSPIPTVDTL